MNTFFRLLPPTLLVLFHGGCGARTSIWEFEDQRSPPQETASGGARASGGASSGGQVSASGGSYDEYPLPPPASGGLIEMGGQGGQSPQPRDCTLETDEPLPEMEPVGPPLPLLGGTPSLTAIDPIGLSFSAGVFYFGANFGGPQAAQILSWSPNDNLQLTWPVTAPYGSTLKDLTATDQGVIAAGVRPSTTGYFGENHGFLSAFDAEGTSNWSVEFFNPMEWYLSAQVAADGDNIYLASQVMPIGSCTYDANCIKTCASGIESNVAVRGFDTNGEQIWATQYNALFNFAAFSDFEVVDDVLYLSGSLSRDSGVHTFDTQGNLLSRHKRDELGGSAAYFLAPDPTGDVYVLMAEDNGNNQTLSKLSGDVGEVIGPIPNAELDGFYDMLATDTEVRLVGKDRATNRISYLRLDKTAQVIERLTPNGGEVDFPIELIRTDSGEVYVGGVTRTQAGDVPFIRAWPSP